MNITTTLNFLQVAHMGAEAVGQMAEHPTEGRGRVTDVRTVGSLVIITMLINGNLVVDAGTQILTVA